MATEKDIIEQIEDLRKQLDENIREEQQRKEQASYEQGKSIDDKIEEVRRQIRNNEIENLLKESEKQNEEYILDLSKQIREKRIILNYILDELINLREQKEENIINYLEDEFERLRKERRALEERLFKAKELIRCFR